MRMSALRDRYRPPMPAITGIADLTAWIQDTNRKFMTATKFLTPQILIELLERYDDEMLRELAALDPDAPGLGVASAGEMGSANWFDLAREYTEKWHHQQQLRDATGRRHARRRAGDRRRATLRGYPARVAIPVTAGRAATRSYQRITLRCRASSSTTPMPGNISQRVNHARSAMVKPSPTSHSVLPSRRSSTSSFCRMRRLASSGLESKRGVPASTSRSHET
jgi:hypothetical protein